MSYQNVDTDPVFLSSCALDPPMIHDLLVDDDLIHDVDFDERTLTTGSGMPTWYTRCLHFVGGYFVSSSLFSTTISFFFFYFFER